MATNYNYFGNLVTNGLVLDLDAAKLDSYPGSGTTWRDISGNGNNGTLTNGPTFSGIGKQAAIVFDGIDDKVVTTNSFTPTNVTQNIWFQFNNISDQICAQSWNYSTTGGFTIEIFGGLLLFAVNGPSGAYPTFPVSSSITGSFRNLTGTLSGNTQTLYINGAPASSVTDANRNNSNSNTPLTIGARSTGGPSTSFSNGRCGVSQVYNRALSQFEVWQNFNALKGRYGIPDIVTNGLVLNLDAGNPYSYLSGSSGTTWTNVAPISSSISGTLTNGPVYANGAITFDGSNDYVIGNGVFVTTEATSIVWFRTSNTYSNNYLLALPWISAGSNGFDIGFNGTNSLMGVVITTSGNVVFSYPTTYSDNKWHMAAMTYSASNASLYYDGLLVATTSSLSGPLRQTTNGEFNIARFGSFGAHVAANISSAQVYNRALSAAEIQQNFNALRGRYGI